MTRPARSRDIVRVALVVAGLSALAGCPSFPERTVTCPGAPGCDPGDASVFADAGAMTDVIVLDDGVLTPRPDVTLDAVVADDVVPPTDTGSMPTDTTQPPPDERDATIARDVAEEPDVTRIDDTADVCTPACGTRVCGNNGCGGSCGLCTGTNFTCNPLGHCVCIPNCASRVCGTDGCGGSCGVCGGTSICTPSGTCMPCSIACGTIRCPCTLSCCGLNRCC